MTDITKALSDLPPFSSPVAYRDTWQAGCEIALQDVMALRARLALAEQIISYAVDNPHFDSEEFDSDARAYLAHRAKETT